MAKVSKTIDGLENVMIEVKMDRQQFIHFLISNDVKTEGRNVDVYSYQDKETQKRHVMMKQRDMKHNIVDILFKPSHQLLRADIDAYNNARERKNLPPIEFGEDINPVDRDNLLVDFNTPHDARISVKKIEAFHAYYNTKKRDIENIMNQNLKVYVDEETITSAEEYEIQAMVREYHCYWSDGQFKKHLEDPNLLEQEQLFLQFHALLTKPFDEDHPLDQEMWKYLGNWNLAERKHMANKAKKLELASDIAQKCVVYQAI